MAYQPDTIKSNYILQWHNVQQAHLIFVIFCTTAIWGWDILHLKVRNSRQNCVQTSTQCVKQFFRVPIGKFYTWLKFLHNQQLWWSLQISSVPLVWVSFSLLPLYTTVKAHMSLFVSFLVWNFSSCNKV